MYICPECGLLRLPLFHVCFAKTITVTHVDDGAQSLVSTPDEEPQPGAQADILVFDDALLAHLEDARSRYQSGTLTEWPGEDHGGMVVA